MEALTQFLPLIILIVLMYVLMIRPQKKKDKEVKAMRNSLTAGDQIVTIGGICGKVVKVKEETIIIQVGADKVKFEMMKWAVSTVTKESAKRAERTFDNENVEETETKKMPKRLKKSSDVEELEKAEEKAAPMEAVTEEAAFETAETTEE